MANGKTTKSGESESGRTPFLRKSSSTTVVKEEKGTTHSLEELEIKRRRKEEIAMSRKKAIERLKEKRNENLIEEKKMSIDLERKEHEAEEKWKKLKESRKQQVKETVERSYVIRAMHQHPQIFEKSGTSHLRSIWQEMLPSPVETDNSDFDEASPKMSHPISSSLTVKNTEEEEIQSQETHDLDELPTTSPMMRSRLSSANQPMPVTSTFLRRTVSVSTPAIHNLGGKLHEGLLSRFIRPRGHTVDVLPSLDGKGIDSNLMLGLDKATTSPTNLPKLVDCLLLVGPSKEDLERHIERMKSEMLGSDIGLDSSFQEPIPNSSTPVKIPCIPNVLYMSPLDPALEAEYLRYGPFPRGIETTLVCSNSPPSQRRPSFPTPLPNNQMNDSISTDTDNLPVIRCGYESSSFIRFLYILTGHYTKQLGICLTIPVTFTYSLKGLTFTIKTRYCLTVLTHFPYIRFFFHILTEFVLGGGLFTSHSGIITPQLPGDPIQSDLRQLENFASKLFRTTIPKPGKVLDLHFTINLVHHEYSMKRLSFPSLDQEISTNILLWSLPILLKYIPLDQLLLIIGCALTEMHIIFRCTNLEVLSACVLGCLSLLSPISWAGTTIAILPPRMHDYLDSPSPIFYGVESMPQNFKMTNGLIIVDPLQKLVHMHPTDVVASHNYCLPYASKLHAALKPTADNILKLSRKVKNRKRSSPTVVPGTNSRSSPDKTSIDNLESISIDDNDSITETSSRSGDNSYQSPQLRSSTATFMSSNISQRNSFSGMTQRGTSHRSASWTGSGLYSANDRPLSDSLTKPALGFSSFSPTPFDDFTNTSPILNTAVMSFVDTMKDHIQKVINTAVQLREERENIKINLQNTPKEIHLTRTISDGSIESSSDASNVNFSRSQNPTSSDAKPSNTLPRFSVGSGAAAFLQMFQNSQAFSVYLESLTPTPPSPEKNPHINSQLPPRSSPVGSNEDLSTPRGQESSDGNSEGGGRRGLKRIDSDPLILLFNMMISGTCPLQKQELYDLKERFLSLYPLDKSSEPFIDHQKSGSRQSSPISHLLMAPSVDTLETVRSVDMNLHLFSVDNNNNFNNNSSLLSFEKDLWCNGRCGGLANTDKCTNICLHVWEEKMIQLRKQTTAIDIVKKNRTILRTQPSHRKDSNHPSHFLAMPTSIKLPSGETIPTQSICPPPPKKHPRETKSQYLHRVSLVAGQYEENEVQQYLAKDSQEKSIKKSHSLVTRSQSQSSVITELTLPNHHSTITTTTVPTASTSATTTRELPSKQHPHQHKQKSQGLSQKSRYSAIRSIAIYKHKRYVRSCLRRILFVIYRYALRRRFLKYSPFATTIQKHVRGHLVMSHLETLILALMKRKCECEKLKLNKSEEHMCENMTPNISPEVVAINEVDLKMATKENSNRALIVQKQLSTESTSSALSISKLIKQASGNSDDPGNSSSVVNVTPVSNASTSGIALSKPPLHRIISSSTSSRGLLGGLISPLSPSSSQRSLFGEKQNPKTLYQKRSFSRTYSDVLSRQESEMKSRIVEPNEEENRKLERDHSLGSDVSSDNQPYSPAVPYVPDSPEMLGATHSPSIRSNKSQSLLDAKSSSKSLSSFFPDIEDSSNLPSQSLNTLPDEDTNRLSLESVSTVKTSETIKKEEPKRKISQPPEIKSSFSLSNFSLTRPFSRSDNKSPLPTRPNLSTIAEDLRRSQSSVGTPPRADEPQFTFKNTSDVENNSTIPDANQSTKRGHRVINSDASSLDFNFDELGSSTQGPSLPSSYPPPCIEQLGTIGAEILTGNQKQSIVELCNLLMGGILVLKHSRNGKPSLRTLYCDEALTTLYWSEVGKIVDGKGDVLFDASGQSQTSFHDVQLSDTVGARFQHLMDQNTIRSMTKKRRSSIGLNGLKIFSKSNHREVNIPEILEVRDDLSTDIMKRAIAKKLVDENRKPSLVISIILKDRSLNFEVEEVHWGPVFFTLQILVNFYQVRCKQRLSRGYSDPSEFILKAEDQGKESESENEMNRYKR